MLQSIERFVHSVVRRYRRTSPWLRRVPYEDLAQEAMYAAARAVRTFDPALGFALTTYAGDCVAHCLIGVQARLRTGKGRAQLRTASLDAFLAGSGEGSPMGLPDPSAPDPAREAVARDMAGLQGRQVGEALRRLEAEWPRDAQVVRWRFFDGLTLGQCAERMDRSKQLMQQLESRGLARLREILVAMGVGEEQP